MNGDDEATANASLMQDIEKIQPADVTIHQRVEEIARLHARIAELEATIDSLRLEFGTGREQL
jgi:cell division protein FtsB